MPLLKQSNRVCESAFLPEVEPADEAREEHLNTQRAEEILDHLDQFAYANRDHVIVAILWHAGIRLGSLRAFDIRDFEPEEQCLDLRHRPDTGTPLKTRSPLNDRSRSVRTTAK